MFSLIHKLQASVFYFVFVISLTTNLLQQELPYCIFVFYGFNLRFIVTDIDFTDGSLPRFDLLCV
jgi:hypothetical protein